MKISSKNYSDSEVEINEFGIKLKCYYFPTCSSKFVPWTSVKGVRVEKLSAKNGLWRVWGMNLATIWFNFSINRRWSRSQLAFIIENSRVIRPGFTPENSDLVVQAILSNDVSLDRSAIE